MARALAARDVDAQAFPASDEQRSAKLRACAADARSPRSSSGDAPIGRALSSAQQGEGSDPIERRSAGRSASLDRVEMGCTSPLERCYTLAIVRSETSLMPFAKLERVAARAA